LAANRAVNISNLSHRIIVFVALLDVFFEQKFVDANKAEFIRAMSFKVLPPKLLLIRITKTPQPQLILAIFDDTLTLLIFIQTSWSFWHRIVVGAFMRSSIKMHCKMLQEVRRMNWDVAKRAVC